MDIGKYNLLESVQTQLAITEPIFNLKIQLVQGFNRMKHSPFSSFSHSFIEYISLLTISN